MRSGRDRRGGLWWTGLCRGGRLERRSVSIFRCVMGSKRNAYPSYRTVWTSRAFPRPPPDLVFGGDVACSVSPRAAQSKSASAPAAARAVRRQRRWRSRRASRRHTRMVGCRSRTTRRGATRRTRRRAGRRRGRTPSLKARGRCEQGAHGVVDEGGPALLARLARHHWRIVRRACARGSLAGHRPHATNRECTTPRWSSTGETTSRDFRTYGFRAASCRVCCSMELQSVSADMSC